MLSLRPITRYFALFPFQQVITPTICSCLVIFHCRHTALALYQFKTFTHRRSVLKLEWCACLRSLSGAPYDHAGTHTHTNARAQTHKTPPLTWFIQSQLGTVLDFNMSEAFPDYPREKYLFPPCCNDLQLWRWFPNPVSTLHIMWN